MVEKVNLRDSQNRLQKGIKTINSYFQENDMSYMIISKRTSKTIKGKKKRFTYWEIIKDVNYN